MRRRIQPSEERLGRVKDREVKLKGGGVAVGLKRLSHTPAQTRSVMRGRHVPPPTLGPLSTSLLYLTPPPSPSIPPRARQTDPAGLWHNHFISPSSGTAACANSDCPPPTPPPTGTTVAQVTATDADDPTFGNNAKLLYSILQGEPYFSVEPKTGRTCRLSSRHQSVLSLCHCEGLYIFFFKC